MARLRLIAEDKQYAMAVRLEDPERGTWTLEATSGQGALLDIVHTVHKGMETARALLKGGGAQDRPMDIPLSGPSGPMSTPSTPTPGSASSCRDMISSTAHPSLTTNIPSGGVKPRR